MSSHYQWYHCPAVLTPKECAKLLKHATRRYPSQPAVVGHGGKARKDDTLRRSTVRWLDFADLDLYWFFRRIERETLRANALFDLEIQHASTEWQLTEYDSADRGLYDWHQDSSELCKEPYERKLTLVLQLTDPKLYEGGKFELRGDPIPPDVFVNPGDLLFFRSNLWHRATEVTQGKRHSLVSWIKGPRR
jgi:PKHD-type hydroxylase